MHLLLIQVCPAAHVWSVGLLENLLRLLSHTVMPSVVLGGLWSLAAGSRLVSRGPRISKRWGEMFKLDQAEKKDCDYMKLYAQFEIPRP